jgi:predicted anti-sigma-YlaC factor YlaD
MSAFQARRERHRCDRIREWVSLDADGELSRIERALVERHLGACPECTAFAADVEGFTRALRTAPLEPLAEPIVLPRRTRVSLRSFQVAAAATVAVVAVGVASLSSSLRDEGLGASTPQIRVDEGTDELRARQLQQLTRRDALTAPRPVGTQPV